MGEALICGWGARLSVGEHEEVGGGYESGLHAPSCRFQTPDVRIGNRIFSFDEKFRTDNGAQLHTELRSCRLVAPKGALVSLLSYMESIPPLLVYLVVGGLVMVESFGVPVPGETAVITGAIMASMHRFGIDPWVLAGSAALGASVGDSIGYLVGHHWGRRLLMWSTRKFPRHVSVDHIAFAESLMDRHGMWTVFLGRFVALLRMLAGPLAGALKMHYYKFLGANVLGAILWAGATTMTIYYLGSAAERYLHSAGWVLLGLLVVAGLVGARYLRRYMERQVALFAAAREAGEANPVVE